MRVFFLLMRVLCAFFWRAEVDRLNRRPTKKSHELETSRSALSSGPDPDTDLERASQIGLLAQITLVGSEILSW